MEVTLVMFKADGERREFPLRHTQTVIGRKRTCGLRIPVPSVSREHCSIEVADDAVTVRDLGSSNGTAVNGKPVKQAALRAGDRLTIGPVHLVVVVDGEPAEVEPIPTILATDAAAEPGEQPADIEEGAAAVAVAFDEETEEEALDIDALDGEGEAPVTLDEEEGLDLAAVGEDDGESFAFDEAEAGEEEAAPIAMEEEAEEEASELDISLEEEGEGSVEIAMAEESGEIDFAPEESEEEADEEEVEGIAFEESEESAAIGLAEESGEIAPASEPVPQPHAEGDDDDEDPFADLIADDGANDEEVDLGELAEAFGEDEEED